MLGIFGNRAVPFSAILLGFSGLLPFIIFSSLEIVEWDIGISDTTFALRAYSAVILSFLGGVIWGIGIQNYREQAIDDMKITLILVISVIPSLIGWIGLLVDQTLGVWFLLFGFVLIFLIDLRLGKNYIAPDWYPQLRKPLTAIVVACLFLVLVKGA